MKRAFLFIVFALFVKSTFAQDGHQRLIVAEFRVDKPKEGNFAYLVSYNFENGILKSKDTILGAETFRKMKDGSFLRYVRFEFGRNFIYRNRYVVSGTGNVIDIRKRALVTEEADDFVKAVGDTLIFHRANIFTGTGFLAMDLKTGKYEFIDHREWDRGRDKRYSPDSVYYLSVDKSVLPYKIWLQDRYGKEKIVVKDAAQGPSTSDAQFPDITTTWLNNHCFLYSVHTPIGYENNRSIHPGFFLLSQISKVTLRTFEISTSDDRQFFVLDTVHPGEVNDRFLKDGIGQLIYRTTGYDYYLVDTLNKKLVDYPFYELDKGFSISNRSDKDGDIIRYRDSVIGKIWGTSPVVTENAIAVEYGPTGSNLGYPKGIKVWSNYTKSWMTIDIPWISALIGWINEDEKHFDN